MNLADALLLPQDDLALAVALKSPLFNLTEDELFTLAWNRKGSLRDALTAHAAENGKFRDALDRLAECERRFRTETPFAFYAWLLGGDGGRARILRRLGHEANDALDEFLELAMSYEKKAPASLQGFMAWLRAADTEVKRDMEISRDEVRVMTVHGAKGLEAPGGDHGRHHDVAVGYPAPSPRSFAAGKLAARSWSGPDARPTIRLGVADARNAMLEETEHEYRRLLYVAMTRAADRLIVAGCMPGNRNSVREHSWYDLIKRGLANSDLVFQDDPGWRRRGEKLQASGRRNARDRHRPRRCGNARTPSLPEWLQHPRLRRSKSSTAGCARPIPARMKVRRFRSGESLALRARALLRGTLVHRLLQSLPDVATERRRDAALKYLARNAGGWSDGDREVLADAVLALIGDGRFASVFADGSRAEVSIAGRLERQKRRPALVSGQIDRLVVTPSEVLIVDYKTNHAPPGAAAEAPSGLCPPARALPRGAPEALSPSSGPRRAALDRNP